MTLQGALGSRSWVPPKEISKLQILTDVLVLSERLIACARQRSCEVEAEIEVIDTLLTRRSEKAKMKCAECVNAMNTALGAVVIVMLVVIEQASSKDTAVVVASHLCAVLGALVGKAEKKAWVETVPITAAFLGYRLDDFTVSKRDKSIYVFNFDIYHDRVLAGSFVSPEVSLNPMARNLGASELPVNAEDGTGGVNGADEIGVRRSSKLRKEKKGMGKFKFDAREVIFFFPC